VSHDIGMIRQMTGKKTKVEPERWDKVQTPFFKQVPDHCPYFLRTW
jgi:hypothetical protein